MIQFAAQRVAADPRPLKAARRSSDGTDSSATCAAPSCSHHTGPGAPPPHGSRGQPRGDGRQGVTEPATQVALRFHHGEPPLSPYVRNGRSTENLGNENASPNFRGTIRALFLLQVNGTRRAQDLVSVAQRVFATPLLGGETIGSRNVPKSASLRSSGFLDSLSSDLKRASPN
jgi:hypothetical protein